MQLKTQQHALKIHVGVCGGGEGGEEGSPLAKGNLKISSTEVICRWNFNRWQRLVLLDIHIGSMQNSVTPLPRKIMKCLQIESNAIMSVLSVVLSFLGKH